MTMAFLPVPLRLVSCGSEDGRQRPSDGFVFKAKADYLSVPRLCAFFDRVPAIVEGTIVFSHILPSPPAFTIVSGR